MMGHKEAAKKAIETWVVANDMFEDYECNAMEAAILAYLDARGLVMVPKEPTDEMVQAGDRASVWAVSVGIYQCMLAAAPDPFKDAE
jgi:hypothetical protein